MATTNTIRAQDTGDIRPAITVKTSSYSVLATDMGKTFTTRGASGAVTFTLPAASSALSGAEVKFFNVADQNMLVAGADEEIVCFNDLTADSIAFSTSSEKIGGGILAVCDGASWICVPLATEAQTVTIASA